MNNKGYLTADTSSKADEYYTPENVVAAILPHIPEKVNTIWCPFDGGGSNYVKVLRKAGYNVISSHINEGRDFFEYEPQDYDCIISNPPFSKKDEILERLSKLGKPYALLLPLPSLQGAKRFPYLIGSQALIFDKRINFYNDEACQNQVKGVAFASIYVCKDFLEKDLIFEKLE